MWIRIVIPTEVKSFSVKAFRKIRIRWSLRGVQRLSFDGANMINVYVGLCGQNN